MNTRHTIFLDIDGTILEHVENPLNESPTALEGAADKVWKWHCMGFQIILVTGRPESMRSLTEKDLSSTGFVYDDLLMGIGQGHRILVNDIEDGLDKAHAINVDRNVGVGNVNITLD